MIDNFGLKIWLWIVTILTIVGNFYVAIISAKNLKERKNKDASVCNHILIINLSVSDCLMGVYLMIILVKDVQFAGRYSEFDYEWRSSTICSLAGSLCVISSQTSCFLMAVLTSYRLYAVYYPFKARHASAKPWIIAAVSSWIISVIIALVSNTTRYFKSKVLFLNDFSSSDSVTHDYVTDFACRVAILTNTSQDIDESNWESVQSFLMDEFPQYAPIGEIGYYGTTSVCMPRLYVNCSDSFWIYSIVIVTFNFLSFLFVLSGFGLIAWKIKKRPFKGDKAQKQHAKMNQRIARIIVSDFLCWVPICIMAYISVSGEKLPDGVEIFTAGVLLPINSAFNPILYSPYIETKVEYLWKRIRPNRNQRPNRNAIEPNVIS
ncbi:relaxin receptor 1-like [Clavelina lepadiformis]|uniref:relaxin receptor 1-like n=1 Tax=Clavelina lepadiformis TaxID=159417 RepID=UPI0040421715